MTFAEKAAAQEGLVRQLAMDEAVLAGGFGDDIGYFINSGQTHPVSAVVETEGNGDKSIKMTIPSQSSAGASGQIFANFSSNRMAQFGPGQTFFVQYMQRFDRGMFEHNFLGGGGWKQSILGAGDPATCTPSATSTCRQSHSSIEQVIQNTFQRGVPQGYSELNPGTAAWEEVFPLSTDIKLQNAYAPGYCRYPLANTDPVAAQCFTYASGLASSSDQLTRWATITQRVQVGSLSLGRWVSTNIQTWWSWTGDAAVPLHNISVTLTPDPGDLFGKIWLLPYHTGKDETEVHTPTFTWYKHLMIATSPIPLTTDEVSGANKLALVRL
jgi:hypothetical protein